MKAVSVKEAHPRTLKILLKAGLARISSRKNVVTKIPIYEYETKKSPEEFIETYKERIKQMIENQGMQKDYPEAWAKNILEDAEVLEKFVRAKEELKAEETQTGASPTPRLEN